MCQLVLLQSFDLLQRALRMAVLVVHLEDLRFLHRLCRRSLARAGLAL